MISHLNANSQTLLMLHEELCQPTKWYYQPCSLLSCYRYDGHRDLLGVDLACLHALCAGCAHNMWKDGGVRGLFKGNLATILKVAPQTAIQFAVGISSSVPCGVKEVYCRAFVPRIMAIMASETGSY